MIAKGYKITKVPFILKVCDVIFLYARKTHNRPLQGVFRESQDCFEPTVLTPKLF
jgi:hypothetical protein